MRLIATAVVLTVVAMGVITAGLILIHHISTKGWLSREDVALGYCAESGADSVVIDGYLVFECEG